MKSKVFAALLYAAMTAAVLFGCNVGSESEGRSAVEVSGDTETFNEEEASIEENASIETMASNDTERKYGKSNTENPQPKTIYLWEQEKYDYPYAGDFLPNITAYLHEDEEMRPAMVIVPGGGYAIASPSEGEVTAKWFFDAGYQTFVLSYTTNMFHLAPLEERPLRDISRAVRYIRKSAEELHIESDQIVCCGFSAGAHLVGSLAVHYQDPVLNDEPDREVSNRPDAVILCYPVITSGELGHRESFRALLGDNPSEEQLSWASLEKHVTADTPPAFLWQTMTDETVPVENSILYAQACRAAEVPCELHLFMEGAHGMSIADENWASNHIGEYSYYTLLQEWETLKALYQEDPAKVPERFLSAAQTETFEDFAAEWDKVIGTLSRPEQPVDASISQWPQLSLAWLDKILGR